MPELPLVNEAISDAYLEYFDKYGVEPDEKIKISLARRKGFRPGLVENLVESIEAFTAIAIEEIRPSKYRRSAMSQDEIKRRLRKAMFFLTPEAFEVFFYHADWCVRKGA